MQMAVVSDLLVCVSVHVNEVDGSHSEHNSRFQTCPPHFYNRRFDPEGDSHLMLYMRTSVSFRHQ